jgi:hypothetical protein
MLPVLVLAIAALLAAAPTVLAQEAETQHADPPPAPAPAAEPRIAIPRSEAPARAPEPPRAEEPARAAEPARGVEQERVAIPRGSRPREDNPAVGVAVPRQGAVRPPADRESRAYRGGVYVAPRVYNNYYSYPRRYYPYGYGAFGLGYFYYNPYGWYPGGYYYGGYYGAHPGYGTFDMGELRLDVSPKHAQVLVDGYYVGLVDDYDGILQGLKLESGGYRIEIVAPGYETLMFDVRIVPGQKTRYRGELIRLRP